MSYQWILFDLDGTLTDPVIGITSGVQYALEKFGIRETDRKKLYSFIGPVLTESFQNYYNFTLEQAKEAAGYFREYYERQGKFENVVYNGIPAMLAELKSEGKQLFVATLKGTNFAREIMDYFGLTKYFVGIEGQKVDGDNTPKSQIILQVLKKYEIEDLNQVVMVGDREQDIIAAREAGILDIGVLYGYGDQEELEAVGARRIVSDVKELWEELLY